MGEAATSLGWGLCCAPGGAGAEQPLWALPPEASSTPHPCPKSRDITTQRPLEGEIALLEPLREKLRGRESWRVRGQKLGVRGPSYEIAGEAPLLLDVGDVGGDHNVVGKLLKVAEGGGGKESLVTT